MKKTYNIPEIEITVFKAENVLTASGGYSDLTKSTEENVNNYLQENNYVEAASVILTW